MRDALPPPDRPEPEGEVYYESPIDQPPDRPQSEPPRMRGGCCGWGALLVLIASIAAGWGLWWALRAAVTRGVAEPLRVTFGEVSLLPSDRIQLAEPDLEVKIFYVAQGRELEAQPFRLPRPGGTAERVHVIAQQLQAAPPTDMLASPLPKGTAIRALYVLNGIVWLDLSKEFLTPADPTPLGERLAVYGLVNSFLLNDQTLRGVRILVDGRQVTTAWGWMDLSNPLGPDLSLVR